MPRETPQKELYEQTVEALKRKISGYTLEESKKTYVYESGKRRVKNETITKKEIGPDLSAIQFVLTNLAPARWSHKPREGNEVSENESKPDLSRLSQTALDELNRLCEE